MGIYKDIQGLFVYVVYIYTYIRIYGYVGGT